MAQRNLQQNNFSPMGQGQPSQNKNAKHTGNFMDDVVGMNDPVMEAVAPGIPAAQIGAQMGMKSPTGFNDVAQAPRMQNQQNNSTMPIAPPSQGTPGVPAGFQGQGTGWRGLDLTPKQNTGVNAFTGFNMDRAMAGGDPKSTKDAFARWASGFGQSIQGLDKAPGGALEQLMRSRLDEARAMGLNIQDIRGEKILIDAYENPGQMNWVDTVKNAGANGEWAWQPEGIPSTSPANNLYSKYQQQLTSQAVAPDQDLEELLMALMSQNQEQI